LAGELGLFSHTLASWLTNAIALFLSHSPVPTLQLPQGEMCRLLLIWELGNFFS